MSEFVTKYQQVLKHTIFLPTSAHTCFSKWSLLYGISLTLQPELNNVFVNPSQLCPSITTNQQMIQQHSTYW